MAQAHELKLTSTRYLLDTDVVLALIRANPLGRWIDETYQLSDAPTRALVSIVTVGELMSFAHRAKNWGDAKRARYEALIQELVWIDINDTAVLDAYARVDCFSISADKSLSKNDIWIAASARVTGAMLLTTDKDFDHLQGSWIDRTWIDPQAGKTS